MHIHQQNQWDYIIFYWYQSYHWYQWTMGLTNRIRLCILDMCGVQITTQNMKRREVCSVITQQNHGKHKRRKGRTNLKRLKLIEIVILKTRSVNQNQFSSSFWCL